MELRWEPLLIPIPRSEAQQAWALIQARLVGDFGQLSLVLQPQVPHLSEADLPGDLREAAQL